MGVHMYSGMERNEAVDIRSLISLEDAGFADGAACYRGLDTEHVEHLALANQADWPAIEVVCCEHQGRSVYAVIDGYHRWEAALAMKAETILVRAGVYRSEAEVIDAAFRANLRNGRNASTGERSAYALWLFWQDTSNKPNLSAIARKVGLNQSTVSRAINKEVRRLEAEIDAEKGGTSVAEITETQRLLKAIRRYMENETAFLASQRGERSVKKRATSLLNQIATMKDTGKQKTVIQDLQTLTATLNQIAWND